MRTYESLPKKYREMFDNYYDLRERFAAWSSPIRKGDYIYYIYRTRVQGDCDEVYRLTNDDHERVMKFGRIGKYIDTSYIRENFEPYAKSTPIW